MKLNRKYLLVFIPMTLLVILVVAWSFRGNEFRLNVKDAHHLSLETGYALSLEQLEDLKTEHEVMLVDVRQEEAFLQGHPEGALSIPLESMLEKDKLRILRKSENPVIIYSDNMSETTAAWALLNQQGIDGLYILELPDGIVLSDTLASDVRRYKDEELRFIFEPDTAVFRLAQSPVE